MLLHQVSVTTTALDYVTVDAITSSDIKLMFYVGSGSFNKSACK